LSLIAGSRLGPYEIQAPLGAGGMGEVYRARDARLGRDVAIKILPPEFASDPERLARFEREAKLLASLSHPNIAAIYGFEEANGQRFLALELAEGETLAERIARGPLPVDEALEVAHQIADALEAAHEKGVVHRDLKPANVKAPPDGKVKVLDFGLARALEGSSTTEVSGTELTQSPTLTGRMTQAGVILGTAAYMSPEQARGRSVDKRSDIWAFGAVLYEMLTGRRTFDGETVSDTLAAVLRADVDWEALPPETPDSVRRLLRRCLERDPKRRLHDIADARFELEARDAPASPVAPSPQRRPPVGRLLLASLAAIAILALALVAARASIGRPAAAKLRLSILLSPDEPMPEDLGSSVVVSPDGTRLAYVTAGTKPALHVRRLDQLTGTAIPDTDGASSPFFSPDGKWIAFFAAGKLRRVPSSGGPVVEIGDAPNPRGGAWASDGTIVFSPTSASGLVSIPVSGGPPRSLTKPNASASERSHRWPSFLPGGRTVLFMTQQRGRDYDDGAIEAVDMASGSRKVVLRGGAFPRYALSGHLLFARRGTVMAVPFDTRRLETTGAPASVLEQVLSMTGGEATGDGSANFDVSPSGLLVYRAGIAAARAASLLVTDRKGALVREFPDAKPFSDPKFSPDGRRIAVQVDGIPSSIWVGEVESGDLRRLTFGVRALTPSWSPDGGVVTYASNEAYDEDVLGRAAGAAQSALPAPRRAIYWKNANGTGEQHRLWEGEGMLFNPAWSPDGRTLYFQAGFPNSRYDLQSIHLDGPLRPGVKATEARLRLQTPFDEIMPAVSPDGRWIAYMSDETGRWEVYLRRSDGVEGKWQVSDGGGEYPRWSRDWTLYFYRGPTIFAVRITAQGDSPQISRADRILDLTVLNASAFRGFTFFSNYDISGDGQRFVFVGDAPGHEPDRQHAILVSDWLEDVRRLAPSKGGAP
jgi:serine/threonine-protein kinase